MAAEMAAREAVAKAAARRLKAPSLGLTSALSR